MMLAHPNRWRHAPLRYARRVQTELILLGLPALVQDLAIAALVIGAVVGISVYVGGIGL